MKTDVAKIFRVFVGRDAPGVGVRRGRVWALVKAV
jgi:hypothetical protein